MHLHLESPSTFAEHNANVIAILYYRSLEMLKKKNFVNYYFLNFKLEYFRKGKFVTAELGASFIDNHFTVVSIAM